MHHSQIRELYTFYQNELKENILGFWLPRCEDREFGGFVNCFTNSGDKLVSHDKYTWSQGRFVWMFARLSVTPAPAFSQETREHFLKMARQGAQFLMDHCIIDKEEENWRATFLMERDGSKQDKVVALPVRDPYHITRNLILILELLAEKLRKLNAKGRVERPMSLS